METKPNVQPSFLARIVGVGVLLTVAYGLSHKNISPLESLLIICVLSGVIWIISDSIILHLYKRRTIFSLVFSVVIICFLSIEVSLRYLTSHYLTYFEKIQNSYISYYDIYHNIQLKYPSNDTLHFSSRGEYSYYFRTNSEGYCDKEWTVEKAEDEYRILCLGDSFTLGMGAPQDSGWVKSFEHHYNTKSQFITTMNAGVTGSDIINEFHKLKTNLFKYKPDAVLLCLNASDIVDIYLRGGHERFTQPEKSSAVSPLGKLESLYKFCFLYRAWIHNVLKRDFLFLSQSEFKKNGDKSKFIIQSEITAIRKFCLERDIDFFFAIHPHGFEIKSNQYMYEDFNDVRKGKEFFSCDLMTDFTSLEHSEDIFHARDRHFNTKGYQILGKLIAHHFSRMKQDQAF